MLAPARTRVNPQRCRFVTPNTYTGAAMSQGVRFWPPEAPLPPGVAWAVARAFADPGLALAATELGGAALEAALALGLLPRIYARVAANVLRAELGASFDDAVRASHGSVARGLLLERTLRLVDESARTLGVSYALLKGSAIVRHLGSHLGARGACDVDVLVRPADAQRLHGELRRRGFSAPTPTHPYFHLPLLSEPWGGAIELHTCLPDVRLGPHQPEATLDDLIEQDRAIPSAAASDRALLPDAETLLAHALAHGLAQHGYAPAGYPLLRMVADVSDLAPRLPTGARERVLRGLAPAVPADEVLAVFHIADALVEGRIASLWTGNQGTSRLLRHMVLGPFDADYARGLKLQGALHELRGSRSLGALREYARSTFALPEADVPRIYGDGAAGNEQRLKLLRPFDVAWRILRMLPDAAKIQARRLRG